VVVGSEQAAAAGVARRTRSATAAAAAAAGWDAGSGEGCRQWGGVAAGAGVVVASDGAGERAGGAGGTGQHGTTSSASRGSYAIPRGPPFFVSCPHYLGEVVVYAGLALLACGHPNALLMLAWVVVNLVLAAGATQAWYRSAFPDYPPGRKALVPFVW
jgi:hypothetical protein